MDLKRLIPDTISARIVFVLVLGLSLSHAASLAIYYGDPVTALTLLGRGHIAERVSTLTRLIERTPLDARSIALAAASNPKQELQLNARVPHGVEATDWKSRLLRSVLADHLGYQGIERVRVSYDGVVSTDALEAPPKLSISILIEDGNWLTFKVPESEFESQFSVRFILSLVLMALTVTVFAIWVVKRVTAPLSGFADAAERFGTDVQAPELPTQGPREVRKAAAAFNEMQGRLRRFVEDRTQLVASISHDLRTPITRLRLRAEFVEDPEQQAKMLSDLDEMEEMIRSTLAFTREEANPEAKEVVDIVALLHSLCDDLSDAGHTVAFDGVGRLPYRCHALALKRALGNLLGNALKYGKRASVNVTERSGGILIRIDDDGPGLPADQLEAVFRPFYRQEASRNRETGGTGLGLTIARSVIRAHGGDVMLENRPKGGLRAEISLPQ